MPKSAVRSRRSVATVTSTAVIGASLAVLLLPVTAPSASAAAAPGSTQRASLVSPNGETPAGIDNKTSALSGNGESVAFTSHSKLDNLDVGQHFEPNLDRNVDNENVYVRDLVKNRTVMISRGQFTRPSGGSSGGPIIRYGPEKQLDLAAPAKAAAQQLEIKDTVPNHDSYSPSISADGRFVAFATEMRNLFVEDNDSDKEIVVADRDPDGDGNYDEDKPNGSRDYKYYRVTNDGAFWQPGLPKIAANGSRVIWLQGEGNSEMWTATLNLRAGQVGAMERVPADISTGINDNPILINQFDPAISGDGNHIAMHATYQPNCDCDDFHAIVSTDMRNKQSTRVDFDQGGRKISTNFLEFVMRPAINNDGTVIAFVAEQFMWDGEGPPVSEFYEPTAYVVNVNYGLQPGRRVVASQIVSRDNNFTIINGDRPGLSNDGRYIAFVTNNLKAHDGTDGQPTNGDCIEPAQNTVGNSGEPMLRLNALPPRRNAADTTCQVVVRDLIVDRERLVSEQSRLPGTLVSADRDGGTGNGNTVPDVGESTAPSLSDNGGRVAYDSDATDLVPPDNNRATDVFVRTMEPTLSGKTVEFGPVEIGTSSTRTAVLTESGSGPLVVEQLSIIGPNAGDFTVSAETCRAQTIHATGSCEVSVRFAPTAIGDRRAQLLVQIGGGRRTVVDLTGSGTEQPPVPPKGPNFSAAPDTLAFGTRLLLSSGPESAVTITNSGDQPLQIPTIDFVGATAPDYKITKNTCGTSVAAGGQCAVTVSFSPKGSGNRNAVLRFNDNAPGGPHLIALTGAANQPTIQVNPGVTPPGRVVAVIGKDFPPNMVVTVKFDGRIGETTVRPANDGTFRAQLLIFPKASPETRTVLATMPEFTDPLARTPLLIVYPTVSPANFVVRG